ncbi:MAG: hypothetical protein ABI867_23050 [Kofleriaceae bacterium]
MRFVVLLVLVAGCKDQAPEPAKPIPAVQPSGTPPMKTTHAPGKATLEALAALPQPGFTPRIRKLDDGFLDVELTGTDITVTVVVSACVACKPIQLDAARADRDALAITVPPELRDRGDTVVEIGEASLGGAKVIEVYQLARTDEAASHAVVVYFNDGVTQLRVIAAYAGPAPPTRDELARIVPRARLEQVALGFAEAITQAWAR